MYNIYNCYYVIIDKTNVQQILYQIGIMYISKTICLLLFTAFWDVKLCGLVDMCQSSFQNVCTLLMNCTVSHVEG